MVLSEEAGVVDIVSVLDSAASVLGAVVDSSLLAGVVEASKIEKNVK